MITAGPDGALWFTEKGANQIGRITTQGVVTEFTISGSNNVPDGITTGPDGNLWFTNDVGNSIGRITPTGTVTLFSTGLTQFSTAFSIVSGPDGNLYFTEAYGDRIGQVILPDTSVTSAQVESLPSPTSGVSFTAPLATFLDKSLLANLTNFQATIDWGDKSDSVGTITGGSGQPFTIAGTHTYLTSGVFSGTITIGNATNNATPLPFTIFVQPPITISASAVNIYATQGNLFNGPVANFFVSSGITGGAVVQNPSSQTVTTYTATINWGDGTPATQGTVQETSFSSFQVFGSHTYTKLGQFQAVVTINQAGGPATTTVNVPALVEVAGPIDEVKNGLTASPSSITAGSDGNLWFTEINSTFIGRITTGGVVTEFPTGLASGIVPNFITSGPDGNLWFTESGATAIGRITPQGVVTEFTQGFNSGSYPDEITSGPGNTLWFTDSSGAIGRITTQGVVTEFTQGLGSGSFPQAITLGPDGNLWFTDEESQQNLSAIGRITPQGVITLFPMSGSSNQLTSITAGFDGNLWFTEDSPAAIGRISTSGVFNGQFSQGLFSDSLPQVITPGPDGNLWFTDSQTNHVDRITSAGVITPFAIPTSNSGALSIVTGSDDNLWFTETTAGQIGQVVTPQSVIPIAVSLNATAGQPLTAAYGSFRDKSSLVDLTRFFTPAITFGDGTSGTGSLVSDGQGGYVVNATHTYANPGTISGSVTITDVIGTSARPP